MQYGVTQLGQTEPPFQNAYWDEDARGLRYCINSASLRFIPLQKMKEEGYEDYIKLLEE